MQLMKQDDVTLQQPLVTASRQRPASGA